jgi:hypothetical protein
MTIEPIEPRQPIQRVIPPRLLTVAEYLEIGEVEPGYTELIEGRLLLSPNPGPDHNSATAPFPAQIDLDALL